MSPESIPTIQTVSQMTSAIRHLLEGTFRFVHVRGEVSNCRTPYSGHTYFVLKDSNAQVRCVLFKNQKRYLDKPIEDGQEIICHGRVSVYEQRGEYQIIVDTIDQAGAGALQAKFETLKLKLKEEGLFDDNRKRALPPYPQHVVVVTSATGAALQDFLKIYFHITPPCKVSIYPVSVQGKGAAAEITSAIQQINRCMDPDLIVLCRGGGSLEDLWSFNEEQVARAIVSSNIVVVTAIGHEIDFTIADFCSDYRCPTPTAAASHVFSQYAEITQRLNYFKKKLIREINTNLNFYANQLLYSQNKLRLIQNTVQNSLLKTDFTTSRFISAYKANIQKLQQKADQASYKLKQYSPHSRLQLSTKALESIQSRMLRAILYTVERKEATLRGKLALLDSVSPLSTLSRGYSITREKAGRKNGRLITCASQLNSGDKIEVILHEGRLECTVDETFN